LMKLAPSGSFEFVARFVDRSYELLSEHAALAIAESRLPEAFEFLKEKWSTTFDREFRQTLLLPIALTRCDEARDFLISVLESGDVKMGTAAIAALGIYRGDATIRSRAEEIISGPNKGQLLEALRREFE